MKVTYGAFNSLLRDSIGGDSVSDEKAKYVTFNSLLRDSTGFFETGVFVIGRSFQFSLKRFGEGFPVDGRYVTGQLRFQFSLKRFTTTPRRS